ncbi:hypothetical protein CsSME_00036919 [Camellia sinensis var. sinensis]
MEQQRKGGWIPVVNQWKGGRRTGMEASHGLFSVFVDHVPSKMDAKSLFKFFSKFGIVKDVFIPSKRRVVSHSRFGFVRFDCNVAAGVAIQKANGLLVDDKVLEVKAATLDRRKREEHNRRYPEVVKPQFIRRSFEANRSRGHAPFAGQRSFADVVQGVNTNTSIKVTEEGNGWLYESAIIRFNTEHSIHSVREALKEKGLEHILVRKGGGRDVILTFYNQEDLTSNIDNLKAWFKDLSQFVAVLKSGKYLVQERCVWLKCSGIPLHVWNKNTLTKIGRLWGSVLSIEGDVCEPQSFSHARIRIATSNMEFIATSLTLDCNGEGHKIFVCEDPQPDGTYESTSLATCCSVEEVNFPVTDGQEREEDDEVAAVKGMFGAELACPMDTIVEETPCDGGVSRGGACAERLLIDLMEKAGHFSNSNDERQKCIEQVYTPGFVRCMNEVSACSGPGINLEVDLAHFEKQPLKCRPIHSNGFSSRPNVPAPVNGLLSGPLSNLNPCMRNNSAHIQLVQDSISVSSKDHQRNLKNKGKMKSQMEGFTSFARIHAYSNKAAKKHFTKSVIYRPAAKALAQSHSFAGDSSLRNQILSEAAATIQLGKSLGIDYHGKEDIVLNKIAELELKDKEKIATDGKAQQ